MVVFPAPLWVAAITMRGICISTPPAA
jgi:hypothetical protein